MVAPVMSSFDLHQLIDRPYEIVYEQVCTALKAAGFEIAAEIDLAELLAKKSESYIRFLKIVVVCHPDITRRALTIAPSVGVMALCNVAISQIQESDEVEIRIVDPRLSWKLASNTYLGPTAEELNAQLERVIHALK